MKTFEEHLKRGIVKRRKKDLERAESLIKEAEKRLDFFNKIQITENSANYIVENMYDVVRELIEAKLLLEGYKSYSHEATISYMGNLGFPRKDIEFMDKLRETRNKTKYYGYLVNIEYAKNVFEFVKSIYFKLRGK